MPACSTCPEPAVAQWQRRPTAEELATEQDRVQAWRDDQFDGGTVPANHDFGPLPEAGEVTIPVYGCAEHTIHLDLAAQVHAAECTAPHPDHLPGCNCQPEPAPAPQAQPVVVTLPTGWAIPAPTGGAV